MSQLKVRKVVAGYEGSLVLRGVSFDVAHGDLAAVLGPSGSGKSTLLRVIAGLIVPVEGAVMTDDHVLSGPRVHVPPQRRRISLVPQDAALFPHLSVHDNVAFGLPRAQRHSDRVRTLLDLVDMGPFAHRMPGELSGGQRHRVALARALAPEPDLVLLDEPFAALDAALRTHVRAQVRQVLRRTGTTAVMVTHDQDEALSMADHVIVVDDGRVVQAGSPAQVYADPTSRWLATFVGGAAVLPGTWNDGVVECPLGTIPARLATGHVATQGDSVDVVVRPEQVEVAQRDAFPVHGLVRNVAFFGHDAVVTIDLPGHEQPVDVRVMGQHTWQVDTEVALQVRSPVLAFSRPAAA